MVSDPIYSASTVLGLVTDRDVVALTPATGFTSRATVNHWYFANQVADKTFGSTAPTGNQTWTQGNYYPAAGLLLELLPPLSPTLQAAFAPQTLISGGTSSLTFTLTNPNTTALTNVRFTNSLSNVTVASATLGGSCTGVTSTPALTIGATSLDLTVASLAAGGCTITVQVTSATTGSHGNTATGATSNETDQGSPANTATLNVVNQPNPPTVTAKFEPAWMESGSQSTLRITLASPLNIALTNVNFTGSMTGMTVASSTLGGTCAGTTNSPSLTVGATSLNLTVPNLPATGCTVTVSVTSATMGSNPATLTGATATESSGTGAAPPTLHLTVAEDPGFLYVHADHLGTARAVTKPSTNQVVWVNENSEPFGNSMPNGNPSGLGAFVYNLRFPGQYADVETGTTYNYYRDYDPTTGRYRQSDPIGLKGGINTYAYVASQPLMLSDPRGLTWSLEFPGPNDVPPDEGLACVAKVSNETWAKSGKEGWRRNDKLLHCVVSCEAAKKCGQYIARQAGRIREAYQLVAQGYIFEEKWRKDSVDDEIANRYGRLCEPKKDCLAHCRTAY